MLINLDFDFDFVIGDFRIAGRSPDGSSSSITVGAGDGCGAGVGGDVIGSSAPRPSRDGCAGVKSGSGEEMVNLGPSGPFLDFFTGEGDQRDVSCWRCDDESGAVRRERGESRAVVA